MVSLQFTKTRYWVPSFPLMLVILTIVRGILRTQYRVFANCEEIAKVKAKSDKISKTKKFALDYELYLRSEDTSNHRNEAI